MITESELKLKPEAQEALRKLLDVWLEFERRLSKIPIIRRLEQRNFTIEDYKTLLLNLRPQVIEGSRWISRAASSFTAEYSELRSTVIMHAVEEHRDYMMLEKDYVSVGGVKEEIQKSERNIGSEALSGYLMHQATQPNPIHLLGAMFIIEGLGNKMASRWAECIQECLGVEKGATSFLSYHGENDQAHINKMYDLMNSDAINEETVPQIVKTARVVGRLYVLQLEELGNV